MNPVRMTPTQLADWCDSCTGIYAAEQFLDRLETEGYVIVHPDDVPDYLSEYAKNDQRDYDYGRGWNDCRRHIFGDTLAAAEQEELS